MVRKPPEPLESASQKAVIQWWSLVHKRYGLPEFALMAVPNGAWLRGDAKQRAIQMRSLKAQGLRVGWPDLFLASWHWNRPPSDKCHGLMIEMKRRPNKMEPAQEAVMRYLSEAGYRAVVCWSADEAVQAIKEYLA